VIENNAKPVIKNNAKPVIENNAKPVIENTVKPVIENNAKPVIENTVKPVPGNYIKPVPGNYIKPVTLPVPVRHIKPGHHIKHKGKWIWIPGHCKINLIKKRVIIHHKKVVIHKLVKVCVPGKWVYFR
jgi:hypothetical protein